MPRLSSINRICLGLVSLTMTLLLLAGLGGLIPNPEPIEQQARRSFCESTAVSFMALASRMNAEQLQQTLDRIRERNSHVHSMGIRRTDGDLVIHSGPHLTSWSTGPNREIDHHRETIVPILAAGEDWGRLEVCWTGSAVRSAFGIPLRPDLMLTLLTGLAAFLVFTVYLGRVMQHINPGRVVPNRVRDALNALAEGLLVLDRRQSIVLANRSFTKAAGLDADALVGSRPDQLNFQVAGEQNDGQLPWDITATTSKPVKGCLLTRGDGDDQQTYSVSTVPVMDQNEQSRGVVVSFEDVTQLQRKQEELRRALASLKTSTDEVRKQNRELEWLATRDTLTGCLNRRSFFRDYENHWKTATTGHQPMAAVMVDIDHFKSINDNHGHSTGDEVLRVVSRTVMETVTETDLVCRYGGEEFTVLMPNTTMEEAERRAEDCRKAIKALDFTKLKVTASLGVSAMCQNPESPQDLLDQADQCLYVAKRNGRNQVVRWDQAQRQIHKLSEETAPTREEEQQNKEASAIPYHAVAALTSALAHRDQATAVHSRRVADLCVATGEGLLSLRECYVLEIAALLHDIGKIGIPDSILRKTGDLTPEEREQVYRYNRLGVDMVRGSFGASVLTEIVEQHVVHFDLSNADRGAGPDRAPSIAAKILSIANAYDTMVSDLNIRGQVSRAQAFAELRRCAGSQFDPELVERFINAVKLRHHESDTLENCVTKESALSIGLLLEQLIAALDDHDNQRLADIAASLQIAATTHGLPEIASVAHGLQGVLDGEHDEIEVMQLAGELLDLCRATQSRLIQAATPPTGIDNAAEILARPASAT